MTTIPTTPALTTAQPRGSQGLWLASASPRRRRLLEESGYTIRVVRPTIDDGELRMRPGLDPSAWTVALAHAKARSVLSAEPGADQAVIIAADTVVVKGDEVIGQPKDRSDAGRIIRALDGGSHSVTTGVAVIAGGRRWTFADTARVTVGPLDPASVRRYLESGDWQGKAGAYNLMERIENGWPISFEGDPGTIMGLPMKRLRPVLDRVLSIPHGAGNPT